jgi:glutamate formiminotransferase / 5-formyltetrahydrofolate cyclo-ligase
VLLAVPNFSEGRDDATIEALGHALTSGAGPGRVHLLALHRDPDHNRCVFTLAGESGALAPALLAGARVAVDRIDLRRHEGVHPHVGALDVAPLVHLTPDDRGAACAEALVTADLLARHLTVPVLLYGAAARPSWRGACATASSSPTSARHARTPRPAPRSWRPGRRSSRST